VARKKKHKSRTKVTADTAVETVAASAEDLRALCDRAKEQLPSKDAELLVKLVDAYLFLLRLVRARGTTIARLRRLFGLGRREGSKEVLGQSSQDAAKSGNDDDDDSGGSGSSGGDGATGPAPAPTEDGARDKSTAGPTGDASDDASEDDSKAQAQQEPRTKGHGRTGAESYRGATRCVVCHESLQAGDRCPLCGCGNVYELSAPKVIVRVTGGPPLSANVIELQRLRCSGCQTIFTAKPPPSVDIDDDKYDASAVAMIALMHYGSGMPFYRLERLQQQVEIPVADATQWDVVDDAAQWLQPVFKALVAEAAKGAILHNDDTTARILELMGKRREALVAQHKLDDPDRTGLFTTAIVSITEQRQIVIFCSGRQHAGENLADVLQHRSKAMPPPIQMCDALERNLPKDFETILSNCLCHGRRGFVDQVANFPAECRHILWELARVFKNDDHARKEQMTPSQRLAYHQQHSAAVMEQLKAWIDNKFEAKAVEPNSGLGKAMSYLLNHWDALTLFLRVAGAPIDNNICERAIKKMICYRKNSMFFKTLHGADVGDLFLSLIVSAEQNGQSPYHYLVALIECAHLLARDPVDWLPWTYKATLDRRGITLPTLAHWRPDAQSDAAAHASPSPQERNPGHSDERGQRVRQQILSASGHVALPAIECPAVITRPPVPV